MATLNTLVNLNGANGAGPDANLIEDAAGNLFGTTAAYLDYPTYTEQQIARQIVSEDECLSAKLGFSPGTPKDAECEADLADLRRGHEKLIASRTF
jgi:hypothetical protein